MDVLILGASRVASRRVIPALVRIPGVTRIHLASRRSAQLETFVAGKAGLVFREYGEALKGVDPCVVYVSLPNSMHAEWAERALEAGHHVIVDKPAVTSPEAAERLAIVAETRRLCLAEATVWSYHSQVQAALDIFAREGAGLSSVSALFSFPPLPASDFRYDARLGGGSLLDLGPYIASTHRLFFSRAYSELVCRVVARQGSGGVDTAFAVLACYQDGATLIGRFGFTTEYTNALTLLGPGLRIDMEPAYTAPAEKTLSLRIRASDKESVVAVAPVDGFEVFFRTVFQAIESTRYGKFASDLLADAQFVHALRVSAQEVSCGDQSMGLP